ncbi:predicted nucleic acid-binding protein, containing PIN domain [Thermococcus kodakarensis KOD1]|uniref:Predicted nucleic acid-binding protein, containing PIN domain n=1 Tax=Thermococcus kodakarensis (strain ATCC BAA-918 / JCM 12380 / KOD1) TaxID=69014 RepID=Q5JIH0_THEKO|nr:type II toxin-antitoxin system VapC family toxin [Thermococcus kodakarensis]WCN27871.1 type II toxin-antitoxin system VapC family toxin [Thermococcus kodakarensis]WCN30169.1 type II toxin-antitoxin system VapC family toxin [Thermococcus kodakarensis]BAD86184.1 predicted nucleic acid-binding protein, containing PIN domain [Thermococcus kodakarensis KOD1]
MVVIDTNIVIRRVKAGEEIRENITEVTVVEYPPVITYRKFHGEVLLITRRSIATAVELQRRLRKIGRPKQFADIMIAAICITNGEKLITHDSDFKDIREVSELDVEVV